MTVSPTNQAVWQQLDATMQAAFNQMQQGATRWNPGTSEMRPAAAYGMTGVLTSTHSWSLSASNSTDGDS